MLLSEAKWEIRRPVSVPVGHAVGAVSAVAGQFEQLLVEETPVRVAVTVAR